MALPEGRESPCEIFVVVVVEDVDDPIGSES
jgi:hypothetical protein